MKNINTSHPEPVHHATVNASTFEDYNGNPPAPIISYYGARNFHRQRIPCRDADWDKIRMVRELSPRLKRSDGYGSGKDELWFNLIFGNAHGDFLHLEDDKLWAYASTLRRVRSISRRVERYLVERAKEMPEFGTYHLLRVSRGNLSTYAVKMKPEFGLDEEKLALNYGSDFMLWHREFIGALSTRPHGLAVLDGTPGCGKTSYLRHLTVELRATHRFYFVPPSSVGIVSSPDFIDFWNGEKHEAEGKKLVMVLEDAEAALAPRAIDNRSEVSAILNVTDGLLADFLQLHIIATMNCGTADIDQALLRPGRLTAQRTFGRLSHADGHKLARSLGKELPLRSDYSIAEIYGYEPVGSDMERSSRIGFAA
jgi:hypothetical protein